MNVNVTNDGSILVAALRSSSNSVIINLSNINIIIITTISFILGYDSSTASDTETTFTVTVERAGG